jgi:hypothetical protein
MQVYWGNGCQIIPPHDTGIAAAIEANLNLWTLPPLPEIYNNPQLHNPYQATRWGTVLISTMIAFKLLHGANGWTMSIGHVRDLEAAVADSCPYKNVLRTQI